MKILNFKTFEKLNINQISLNDLNTVNHSTITKESLKTFDIVQIKDRKYMVFKNHDAKTYFEFFRIADSTTNYKDIFVRTNTTITRKKPEIQLFNNYTDDLRYWNKKYDVFDIHKIWILEDESFNEYEPMSQMIDLTQYAIQSYIKKYNYTYIEQ